MGGALADRVDRRRFLITLNCFEAAVAAALAVLALQGRATPGLVIALVGDAVGLRWATTLGAAALLAVLTGLAILRPATLLALDPLPEAPSKAGGPSGARSAGGRRRRAARADWPR